MKTLASLLKGLIRFLAVWFVDTLSLLLTAGIFSQITLIPGDDSSKFVTATAVALVVGLVNLVIRPILLLLAVPLGWLVVFLVGFFANAITLMITSGLMSQFEVESWGTAFWGGLFLAFINLIITELLNINHHSIRNYLEKALVISRWFKYKSCKVGIQCSAEYPHCTLSLSRPD